MGIILKGATMKQGQTFVMLLTAATLTFAGGIEHDWIKGYDYSDKVLPSQNPPGNLKAKQCPQFVTIGFDDNSKSGLDEKDPTKIPDNPEGMLWRASTFAI